MMTGSLAKEALRDLNEVVETRGEDRTAELLRKNAIRTAKEAGYWSIWMTVFASDLKTRQLLIQAFKAARSCFDPATTQPQLRVP
jgi:hypothetical protein